MENKVVNLEIKDNLKKVTKDVEKLSDAFQDTAEDIKGVQKSTKGAEDGVKSLSAGFKGMGLAIKAIGIGLVLEAFNLFKDVLGKNQKVVDLFNTAIGALSIAFNDLIGFVTKNFPAVIQIFKDIFENPTTYLKKFGDLVQENLIERFNSFLDTIGFLSDALKKVFEGDFKGALDSVKKAGKESIDILTGVNDSFDKGKKIISDASTAIANYAIETFKASEANINLQNTALIAAAQQAKLVEQYDLQAEQLRKIRDNDLLSISDRIIANDKLKEVLKNQKDAMKTQADLQVAAAAATFNANKTIENQVALINAQANAVGVLAQVEGLTSEQEANRVALKKELVELTQSQIEGTNALEISQQKFNETLNNDELTRLENQRLNLEAEKVIELDRLQNKIDSFALGTQARVDSENEFLVKKQEIDNALTTNEKEQTASRIEISKLEADAKIQNLARGSAMLANISDLIGQNTAAGKVAAVAATTIDTYAAAQSAFKNAQANPISILGPAYPYISAGLAIAGGLKNVKSILAVKTPKGGGGGSVPAGGGMGGGPSAPAFNVVGASPVNQLAQTLGDKQNVPIKAYVVSGEVSTAQALDRNIIKSATLG
jgi:hypothetical protein